MRSVSFISALLACLVLGGLGALTIADLFDGPGTPRQERQARTPDLPEGAGGLPGYLAAARHYIGERYALKDRFVAWNGRAKLALFGHSPADQVALGKDGFLFLTSEGTVPLTQGQNRLTDDEKARWQDAFTAMETAFQEAGIVYGFMLGPNKHTVYPDRLPDWLGPAEIAATRTADVITSLDKALTTWAGDPRQRLIDERSARPEVLLHHPTDTHWTEWGAALVAHDVLAAMGLDLPPPAFKIADLPRSGDLSRMIGQQGRWSAKAPVVSSDWTCRDATGQVFEVITIDPLMPQRFTCGSPGGRREKLVVFHDSFGVSAIPYLAARFQTVEFLWTDAADPAVAEDLQADYVLHIQVERRLMTDRPEAFLAGAGGGS